MNNKLSKDDVKFIRKNYKPHDKLRGCLGLAARFNISPQTVSAIVNGRISRSTDDLDDYIEDKIIMLKYEFCIKLTEDELIHLRALKSESEVDRYAHDILKNRL